MAPSTKSVLTIGEEALSKSILRLGQVDFFSVVTRKPAICDFKPVSVEVAIARLQRTGDGRFRYFCSSASLCQSSAPSIRQISLRYSEGY